MGNRLSKIYTRTGDDGTTGLGDGVRVDKDNPRVEAYGTVDELNSAVGVLLATDSVPADMREMLLDIQHALFNLGGELCMPGHTMIEDSHVDTLESWLDGLNADLPPLKDFVLPGGGASASACHVARAVCRRAERRVQTLSREEPVGQPALKFLNRLSDLLFVMARTLARAESGEEVLWKGGRLSR